MKNRLITITTLFMAAGFSLPAASVENGQVRASVEKSLDVLLKSGPVFVKQSGCVSCHNNTLPVMVTALARQRGLRFDQQSEQAQVKATVGMMAGFREVLWEAPDAAPDIQVSGAYILEALAAQKYPADDTTAAVVHAVAAKQLADGSWPNYINRAPIENGAIQATALSVRTLQLYGMPGRKAEWERRTAQARQWLETAVPRNTEDKVMRLYGLAWSGANPEQVQKAAKALLADQRPDGGWSELPTLESDAYATGKVLVALREAAGMETTTDAYQKGAAYLLRTQREDGSWLVKARAFPFQPLKDSGFPHGRDQWLSAAGTSWAAMALTYMLEPVQVAKQ